MEAIHFLPDYLFEGHGHAIEGNKKLVVETETLLSFPCTENPRKDLLHGTYFNAVCWRSLFYLFQEHRRPSQNHCWIFDIIFFSSAGSARNADGRYMAGPYG